MVPRGWTSTRNFRFFNETGFLNQFRKPGVWLLCSWNRMGNSLNFICLAKHFFFHVWIFVWEFSTEIIRPPHPSMGNQELMVLVKVNVIIQICAHTSRYKWPGVFTACKCRVIYIILYTNHSLELAFFFHWQVSDLVLWVGRGSLASLFKTLNLARSLMGCVRRVVGRVLSGGLSAYGSFWCFILGYVSVMGLGQFYRYWVDRDG